MKKLIYIQIHVYMYCRGKSCGTIFVNDKTFPGARNPR